MKNIYLQKASNQYMVRIRGHYLGCFITLEDANKALEDWKNANPKQKKHIITASLNDKQFLKYQQYGAHKWLKKFLEQE